MITVADLAAIAGTRSRSHMRQQIADAFNSLAAEYGVTEQRHIALFLAHVCVETGGFRRLEENLNYSAKRLMQVWPRRFLTMAKARQYAGNPRKLANYVYGSRMGNKGRADAGWLYRGSGPGQITGYDNFRTVEIATGLPVTSNPDLLRQPESGMRATLILWQAWGMNHYAETDQITASRKRWNGGTHGLTEVKQAYARAMKRQLSVPPAMASLPAVTPQVEALIEDNDEGFLDSGTNKAAMVLGGGGIGSIGSLFAFITDPWVQALLIVVMALIAAAALYIFMSRNRKTKLARDARKSL